MKLPELTQVQFQSAARSQEFDPLQLADPNPQLQQNLQTIQRSFANLQQENKLNAEALYSQPGKMTTGEVIGQMAELLPQAVSTLSELQNVDVAIQMARADDQYYQMLRQGLIPQNGELLAIEQDSKARKELIDGAAVEATEVTNSYDIPRGILNFSNHGEIALKRRLAKHMFTNVYPDWMKSQLEINDSTIMVEDGQGGMVEVQINDPDLPDFQFKQVMSHLRTAFMGHELLADTNNDLIQKEMAVGFATDAQIERDHTRTYRANDGKKRYTSGFNAMLDDFNGGDEFVLTPFKTSVASMPDTKGIGYRNSNAEFYGSFLNHIKTTAANGAEYNLGEFLTKAKFEDGKTFMERAPSQARTIMRTYREERRKYLNNKNKADVQDMKFGVTTFLADCQQSGTCTTADYVEFNQLLAVKGGQLGVSVTDLQGVVSQAQRLSSVEGSALNEYRKQLDIALANGVANSNMEALQNPTMLAEYGEKVRDQEERKSTQEYKDGSKQIEDTIKGTSKTLVDDQGRMKSYTRGANRFYQRMYDKEYANIKAKNATLPDGSRLTEIEIAQQAEDRVLSQWNKDRVDPAHDYYVDPKNGNMPNYPEPEEDKARSVVRNNMNTLATEGKTQSGVLQSVVSNPSLVLSSEEAAAAVQLFQTTGRIDPGLEDKAKLINDGVGKIVITNPIQLALAAAVGHGHIKPEDLKSVQPPAVVRRLNARGRRQYMKDLLQLGGSTYTNLAKYGPAGPNSAMPVRDSMANSVQTIAPGVRGLAQLVQSGEGTYTSMFPSENYANMTDMVIRTELVNFQRQKLRDGRASAAVGAYQFLEPEVAAARAGLPPDAKFTPENQDKMFIATLMTKPGREAIAQYLQGSSNNIELAIDQLAMEFASIEYRNGRSYYQDGVNKAKVTRVRAAAALLSAREEMMRQAR
jgi:hypothetical protein